MRNLKRNVEYKLVSSICEVRTCGREVSASASQSVVCRFEYRRYRLIGAARTITLSRLFTHVYSGQLSLSSFRGRQISTSFGWGIRLQGAWMHHETYAAEGEIG